MERPSLSNSDARLLITLSTLSAEWWNCVWPKTSCICSFFSSILLPNLSVWNVTQHSFPVWVVDLVVPHLLLLPLFPVSLHFWVAFNRLLTYIYKQQKARISGWKDRQRGFGTGRIQDWHQVSKANCGYIQNLESLVTLCKLIHGNGPSFSLSL